MHDLADLQGRATWNLMAGSGVVSGAVCGVTSSWSPLVSGLKVEDEVAGRIDAYRLSSAAIDCCKRFSGSSPAPYSSSDLCSGLAFLKGSEKSRSAAILILGALCHACNHDLR